MPSRHSDGQSSGLSVVCILLYDLTVVLRTCVNQLSRVYLLAFKCSRCNKDCQIPKRVRGGLAATDSDYLKCHALLAALHFPLETTSFLKVNAIVAIL